MTVKDYLLGKIKNAGIPSVKALGERCAVPTATYYRYIRGDNMIPPSVEAAISGILRLTEAERAEFHDLIVRSGSKRPARKVFEMLDDYVFGGSPAAGGDGVEGEVLYFEQDRYLFTVKELFDRMLVNAEAPNFFCSLKIVHGIDGEYFQYLISFIKSIYRRTKQATVEHLINISAKNQAANVQMLLTVLPLLRYDSYSVFYTEEKNPDSQKRMFGRLAYFHTVYDDADGRRKTESFLLAIKENGKATCLCFDNALAHEFITDDFYDLRHKYTNNFTSSRSLNNDLDFLIRHEYEFPVFAIKPDFYYPRISGEVFANMLQRGTSEQRQAAADIIARCPVPPDKVESVIKEVIQAVNTRYLASYAMPATDICSMDGLTEMARTGYAIDHMVYMLPYDKKELRIIFETARDRNADENDHYNLYITRKPILKDNSIIFGYKGESIIFQFDQNSAIVNLDNNLYIKNKAFSELFYEYATGYFPQNHVLSKAETTAFLNSLIDKYM